MQAMNSSVIFPDCEFSTVVNSMHECLYIMCVCVSVCVCVRACVRACVRVCMCVQEYYALCACTFIINKLTSIDYRTS